MKYVPPVGGAVNDPYIDANPGSGIEGSPVPAAAIEHPMREILAVIEAAEIAPSEANLAQLLGALRSNGVFQTQAVGDNSTKAATTGWVRSAMGNIAAAAGFAASLTANGFIKFPSWLGGLIIQWGTVAVVATTGTLVTFPIAFPNQCLNVIACHYQAPVGSGTLSTVAAQIISGSQFGLAASLPSAAYWFATGF